MTRLQVDIVRLIHSATGVTDVVAVATIEGLMRNQVFYSSLDWQTEEQLAIGARSADALRLELKKAQDAHTWRP